MYYSSSNVRWHTLPFNVMVTVCHLTLDGL